MDKVPLYGGAVPDPRTEANIPFLETSLGEVGFLLTAIIGIVFSSRQANARIDPLALDVVRQSDRAMASMKVLNCSLESRSEQRKHDGTFSSIVRRVRLRLQRPNLARVETSIELRESADGPWQEFPQWSTLVGNAKRVLEIDHRNRTFRQLKVGPNGETIGLKMVSPLDGFFHSEARLTNRLNFLQNHEFLNSIVEVGMKELDSVYCRGIAWTFRQVGTDDHYREEVWIGLDNVPREFSRTSFDGRQKAIVKIGSVNHVTSYAEVFGGIPPKSYRPEQRRPN